MQSTESVSEYNRYQQYSLNITYFSNSRLFKTMKPTIRFKNHEWQKMTFET